MGYIYIVKASYEKIILNKVSDQATRVTTQHTYRQHGQKHVVIVDEENELVLPLWELCRHSQNEVLHFYLESSQTLAHPIMRMTLIDAHHCTRELGVAASHLCNDVQHIRVVLVS